jgi:membrane protease subunit HflK
VKRTLLIISLAGLAWLSSGFYIVGGNERGVVRRFGKIDTLAEGGPRLRENGWHYDLPWPFSRVDRINLNEVRTLTVGEPEPSDVDPQQFLEEDRFENDSRFLTGDKNILNAQVVVQYRVSEAAVSDWLFHSENPEATLRQITEAAAADLISQSGVDYVHPLGLTELRLLLTERVQTLADEQRVGVEIDEVSIAGVYPPLQVKAWFVDVSNARADRERAIETALAYAGQQAQSARAAERQRLDEAATDSSRMIQEAKASANRFRKLVNSFRAHGSPGSTRYRQARAMTLQRYYVSTLEELLSRVKNKIVIDGDQPADIMLFGTSPEEQPDAE